MSQQLMLYATAIALGALHAFEPGHGKTLIAAYMVGSRGRALDGMLLGLIVTFTHTFSVIILGIVAKVLARSYSEQQLHVWLGLVSSLIVLGVGLWMLRQRLSGHRGHFHFHLSGHNHHHHEPNDHSHTHLHDDDHHHSHTHDHDHEHGHGHNQDHHGTASSDNQYNKWNLLLLGISGGLIPCPAAIATLLAAIGAGRTAEGLTLALFFSLGLGLVMMAIGITLAHAGKFTKRFAASQEFSRRMGIASALIIIGVGGYTLYHSVLGALT